MYWLFRKGSYRTLQNKVMIYKEILKPHGHMSHNFGGVPEKIISKWYKNSRTYCSGLHKNTCGAV